MAEGKKSGAGCAGKCHREVTGNGALLSILHESHPPGTTLFRMRQGPGGVPSGETSAPAGNTAPGAVSPGTVAGLRWVWDHLSGPGYQAGAPGSREGVFPHRISQTGSHSHVGCDLLHRVGGGGVRQGPGAVSAGGQNHGGPGGDPGDRSGAGLLPGAQHRLHCHGISGGQDL